MFCKNCGNHIEENENFCAKCGTAVEKPVQQISAEEAPTPTLTPISEEIKADNNNVLNATPIEQTNIVENPVVATPTVMASTPVIEQEVVEPPQVVSTQENQPQTPTLNPAPQPTVVNNNSQQPKKGNSAVVIIIILIGVLALGGIGFFVVDKLINNNNNGYEPDNGNSKIGTKTNDDNSTGINTNNNIKTYQGYDFQIPNGFSTNIDSTLGLVIDNGVSLYSVEVDYTNPPSDYVYEFLKKYPNLNESDMKAKINGKDYWFILITNQKESRVVYITTAVKGSATFVGIVENKNGTEPNNKNAKQLVSFLESAKVSGSTFSKSDDDKGKNGIIDLNLSDSNEGKAFNYE